MEERSTTINIGGVEYELLLTTKATKEIAKRYGGIDKLGEKLKLGDNPEDAIDEIIWIVTLLANQPILIHNFKNPNDKKELLTTDVVEILTTPADFGKFQKALVEAMNGGTKRFIESEETKNAVGE